MEAEAIRDKILNDVTSFLNAEPPQDDQTLVVLKRLPSLATFQPADRSPGVTAERQDLPD